MLSRYLPAITLLWACIRSESSVWAADEKSHAADGSSAREFGWIACWHSLKYILSLTGQGPKKCRRSTGRHEGRLYCPSVSKASTPKSPGPFMARSTPPMQTSAAVLQVPVTDEKAFLGLPPRRCFTSSRPRMAITTWFQPDNVPVPIYFRFCRRLRMCRRRVQGALEEGQAYPRHSGDLFAQAAGGAMSRCTSASIRYPTNTSK